LILDINSVYRERKSKRQKLIVDVTSDSVTFTVPDYAKTGKVHVFQNIKFHPIKYTTNKKIWTNIKYLGIYIKIKYKHNKEEIMNFVELCQERFELTKSILCVGLDPVLEKFPFKKDCIEETIVTYFSEILNNFHKYIFAVKPNIAFYEQYGIEGLIALSKVIEVAKGLKIPVILDAKRGDIGNTASAYAKASFVELKADSVTLSPYLGEDSLSPFFEYKDKGFFILARTSNKGSSDFQLLTLEKGEKLYINVTKKIAEWNKKYSSGIGAVAGATHIDELKTIVKIFSDNDCPPLLIPGVGTQGGDLKSIVQVLKEFNYPLHKVFINNSSKITYGFLEKTESHYLDTVESEIKKMMIY